MVKEKYYNFDDKTSIKNKIFFKNLKKIATDILVQQIKTLQARR